MKQIKLNQGKFTIVDDEDYERVSAHTWTAHNNKSGLTFYGIGKIEGKAVKLHRFILGLNGSKPDVDHINGDGLDNRKCNLRLVTRSENLRNRGVNKNNTTGYKGVSWHKRSKMYMASVGFKEKRIWLGYFKTAEEASAAYEAKAKELFGEFYRSSI